MSAWPKDTESGRNVNEAGAGVASEAFARWRNLSVCMVPFISVETATAEIRQLQCALRTCSIAIGLQRDSPVLARATVGKKHL